MDGLKIIALARPSGRFDRIFRNGFIALKKSLGIRAQVYHFHDPELLAVGIILKLMNKLVIYDVHADVSQKIMNTEWLGNRSIRKVVSILFKGAEQFASLFFDRIITVTDDIAAKFNQQKTMIIRNLPILRFIDEVSKRDIPRNRPAIVYSSGISRIRGIREMIQAMEIIGPRAELWLMGKWEDADLQEECRKMPGWEYVKYLGSVPFGQHYGYMKAADIGILNFLPVPELETALGEKAFEYMACSLPIIMSQFPRWQRELKGCALFVNPCLSSDIAEKILTLLDSPGLRKELGDRGRQKFEHEYSWEVESKKLIRLYEGVVHEN
jgi:glycosyltransferase involved in cell wall biosynthesis